MYRFNVFSLMWVLRVEIVTFPIMLKLAAGEGNHIRHLLIEDYIDCLIYTS